MDNVLEPSGSPNGLVGVRRLNHVPLYIIGVIAAAVALIIAMVAMDKSKQAAAQPEDHGGSTDSYAAQAVGERTGYIPAAHSPTPLPMATPPPPVVTSTPVSTPADDTEAKARRTAFLQALYAPSALSDEPANAQTTAQQVEPPVPPSVPYNVNPPSSSATPQGPNALSTYTGAQDRWKLPNRVEKPASKYILQTGWVIPALMLTAMESALPGTIIAQVSQDVYDSPSGQYLLVPQGSRLIGEYANSIAYGHSRIFVAWQRIIFPDGSTLDISAMPGADGQGEAGFHDQVDNHLLRTFGSALLMSAITAGATLSQPNQNQYSNNGAPNASSTLSQALGQQLGAATTALLEKNLSIPPTLKIRQGLHFTVIVVKDLIFNKPYVVPDYDRH